MMACHFVAASLVYLFFPLLFYTFISVMVLLYGAADRREVVPF